MTDLLQFLAPGFLHAMGNAFFGIQGHARLVFNDFERFGPQGEEVLGICNHAARAIEIYRLLADPRMPGDSLPVGQLVVDVASLLRAPLRDVGIKLDYDETAVEIRRQVPSRPVVTAVVAAIHRLTTAVPTGFRGVLTTSVAVGSEDAVHVDWRLAPAAGHLPFAVDVVEAIAAAEGFLGEVGSAAPAEAGTGLRFSLPAEAAP